MPTAMTVIDHAPPQPATTGELLHAAADGDQLAWRELVHRYEPAVTGTILALGMQHADARDAAQRTWLQMFENRSRIREPEALGGWLRTTARRESCGSFASGGGSNPSTTPTAPGSRTRPSTSSSPSSTPTPSAGCAD